MSARSDIAKLLEQWLQLTQAEAAAIQTAAWPALKKIQSTKAALQKTLENEKQRWSQENPAAATSPFKAQIARLISMEARNADLLAAQQLRARAEQATFDQAQRTLRKIQRSYDRSTTPTAWNCYS